MNLRIFILLFFIAIAGTTYAQVKFEAKVSKNKLG